MFVNIYRPWSLMFLYQYFNIYIYFLFFVVCVFWVLFCRHWSGSIHTEVARSDSNSQSQMDANMDGIEITVLDSGGLESPEIGADSVENMRLDFDQQEPSRTDIEIIVLDQGTQEPTGLMTDESRIEQR